MHMKYLIPATLSALLLAGPFAFAEEAHHPDAGTAQAESPATPESAPSGADAQPAAPGGMDMGDAGTMNDQQGQGSGMMGKGMMGGGMMNMMGGQQGQGAGMMGSGGMMGKCMMGKGMMGKGMMRGGKGGGMGMMGKGMMAGMEDDEDRADMGMMRCGGEGHGMRERYRELMGRLDLMEANMAKMEALLERLIER